VTAWAGATDFFTTDFLTGALFFAAFAGGTFTAAFLTAPFFPVDCTLPPSPHRYARRLAP
jgi:hypothetical protein